MNKKNKYSKLLIKFRTTKNEIGYFYYSKIPDGHFKKHGKSRYFFVKGRNKSVRTNGCDKMIHVKDSDFKYLDKPFQFTYLNRSQFTVPKHFLGQRFY